MKFIKILSLVFVLALGFVSCELPDNIDPKAATDVPVSTIFTNAQLSMINHVDASSQNSNVSRLLVQYWQQTTYFDESRYLFQDRKIPDSYSRNFYRNTLMDLKETKTLLGAQDLGGVLAAERDNKVAIATILEVYAWQCLVDAFGNVPYSEALLKDENSTPVYDDAATIYADLHANLSKAIAALDAENGSYGNADLLYGGDVASWKIFGASLQLRLGMRLADVNSGAAKSAVEAAVSTGVFTSQDQSGILNYTGVSPHVSHIYDHFTLGGRKDWLPANTIIDKMKELEDPRIDDYFTQYGEEYIGATYGLNGAQSYPNYSHFAPRFFEATFEANILDYVEVEFLLAEAAERGYSVGGTAEEHYNNAIEASILYWDGTTDDASAYLAKPEVAYSSSNWKEKLGTQKWIALYNRGVEAWAEWRRLDYPILNVPEDMSYGDIPVRYPYPYDENELNEANYDAAVSAMGGDATNIKIFWDVN